MISADGKEYIVEKNDTAVIPPSMVHSVVDFEGCERYSISFLMRKTDARAPGVYI